MYPEAIRIITNDGAGDTVSFFANEIKETPLSFKKTIIVNENNLSKPIVTYFGSGHCLLSIAFDICGLDVRDKVNQIIDANNILKIYYLYRYDVSLFKRMIVINPNNIKQEIQYSLFGEQERGIYLLNFEEIS